MRGSYQKVLIMKPLGDFYTSLEAFITFFRLNHIKQKSSYRIRALDEVMVKNVCKVL